MNKHIRQKCLKYLSMLIIFILLMADSYTYVAKAGTSDVSSSIYSGLINLETEIRVPYTPDTWESIGSIYFETLNRYPEIFYVAGSVSWSSDFKEIFIRPSYSYPKDKIPGMVKQFNEKVTSIISSLIKDDMSDLRKEIEIHDYIVNNVNYTLGYHNAYEAIINNRAVCEGYAKATKHLLDKVGIQNLIVTGTANNGSGNIGHAWNMVKIEGNYYHLDTTWDDPYGNTDRLYYGYFNVSDEIISKTHAWDKSKYPSASDNRFLPIRNIFIKEDGRYTYVSNIRNGNQIYFINASENSINVIDIDGSNQRRFFTGESYDWLRSFTLHGNNIYFTSYSSQLFIKPNSWTSTYVLNRISLDGTNRKIVANWPVIDIRIEGDYLHYTDYDKGGRLNLKMDLTCERLDLNGDFFNDILDLAIAAKHYNENGTDFDSNINGDVTGDGIIDLYDLTIISRYIWQSWKYRTFNEY
jgi:hypothetical protein